MTTKAKSKTAPKDAGQGSGPVWDWAAGHGPVTGALSATTGAWAAATVGAATHMPPGWALAAGAAGAVGHTAAGLKMRNAGRTIAARAASWLVGAGWTTWAITHGPLTWTALGSLATIGIGIGTAARSTTLYEEAREEEARTAEERQIAAELSAERREIATEWAERIKRVCGIDVRILAVEKWTAGTGFTLDAELPGGTTYDKIAAHAAALSADACLPHGCTASAGIGIHQGRALIDVGTVNVLEKATTYPADYGPLSLLTGIPWGYRTNAEEICAHLREQCALVVGPTGSGKTNLIHVILAGFARATDVLPWVIDLNAGSAGLPWVLPALQGGGQGVKPGIDWLASTVPEAIRMLDTALAIARHRKVVYQDLMRQHDTDLLPISPALPQIELVIDEGAEILVSTDRQLRKLGDKILEVVRIARAMGVRTVLTALGATGSVLGNLLLRREAKVRVALTGGELEGMDLGKMFPATRGLRPEQAPYKGSGFMGTPESPASLFKTWSILPSQIREIVHATSARHPVLDGPSATAAGETYATRWDAERTAWMRDPGHQPDQPTPAEEDRPEPCSGLNLRALRDQTDDSESEHDLISRFREQLDALDSPEQINPPPRDQHPQRPGLNLRALHEDNQDPDPAADERHTDARTAALQLVLAAGPDGTGASALERQLRPRFGTTRPTIHGWLQEWVDSGDVVRVGSGSKTRYVHHEHADKH
ncbi:hypothetical protein DEH18_31190 [Streptomyces sp. NHF165]|uniref:hypothetical protein n=1 Tax=Streptomyces sp. NHF165 TaxID=2175864 RepID=UPI00132E85A1|nr:hypothetical protein [Streptomyces sp. NHF165]QHF97577.1 hypothetical protein DEH18_31190 [Streptomyces sp. NHF165]